MINNPYRARYRALIDGPMVDNHWATQAALLVDVYYALDEALGRIYELEQTLEGRERVNDLSGMVPHG